MPEPLYSLSTDPWDLHRRADRDRARHNEKIKEALRENLGDIISQQDIITADRGKIVKVPVRGLELPRTPLRPQRQEAHRPGRRAAPSPATSSAAPPGQQDGQGVGKKAGQEPGVDYYEAEFTVDELAQMVFEDLHLPNLEEKGPSRFCPNTPSSTPSPGAASPPIWTASAHCSKPTAATPDRATRINGKCGPRTSDSRTTNW